jgi:spore maturation protein CgeB
MRIVLVHPGASMSTADVWAGLKAGLQARGHVIYDYALDARIERSGAWLHYCWHRGGRQTDKPGADDVLYHAGEELVARALRVMPDLVLIVSGMYLHPDVAVLLKRAGLRTAILFTESPYDDERQKRLLPFIDLAWTNERSSARELGVRYLPHAWAKGVHDALQVADAGVPAHDVVFVGTGFKERVELLERADWDGIDLGLYGAWELLGSRHPLRRFLRGKYIDNAHAAKLYRRARIGLNLFRLSKGFGKDAPRIAHAESLNPRAYELAALGCFTISERRVEVEETFGDLVPTFGDPAELRPLVDRWLGDPEGRDRVRGMLPAAVAAHTWDARAAAVEEDLLGAGIGASQAHDAAALAAGG